MQTAALFKQTEDCVEIRALVSFLSIVPFRVKDVIFFNQGNGYMCGNQMKINLKGVFIKITFFYCYVAGTKQLIPGRRLTRDVGVFFKDLTSPFLLGFSQKYIVWDNSR